MHHRTVLHYNRPVLFVQAGREPFVTALAGVCVVTIGDRCRKFFSILARSILCPRCVIGGIQLHVVPEFRLLKLYLQFLVLPVLVNPTLLCNRQCSSAAEWPPRNSIFGEELTLNSAGVSASSFASVSTTAVDASLARVAVFLKKMLRDSSLGGGIVCFFVHHQPWNWVFN